MNNAALTCLSHCDDCGTLIRYRCDGCGLIDCESDQCTGHGESAATLAPIPGIDGYVISDRGEVFSQFRRGANRKMTIDRSVLVRKKSSVSKSGYASIGLLANGKMKRFRINRLVAVSWISREPFQGAVVRHLDNNKINNHVSNLAWGTYADNEADTARSGLRPRGTEINTCKLSEDQVLQIRKMRSDGLSYVAIGRHFGVSKDTARKAAIGDNWKWLGRVDGSKSTAEVA